MFTDIQTHVSTAYWTSPSTCLSLRHLQLNQDVFLLPLGSHLNLAFLSDLLLLLPSSQPCNYETTESTLTPSFFISYCNHLPGIADSGFIMS